MRKNKDYPSRARGIRQGVQTRLHPECRLIFERTKDLFEESFGTNFTYPSISLNIAKFLNENHYLNKLKEELKK